METQKGKYKNPKVQISKRCEIVKSNNRIIKKIGKFKNKKVQICKRCEIVKSNNRIIQNPRVKICKVEIKRKYIPKVFQSGNILLHQLSNSNYCVSLNRLVLQHRK